MNSNIIGKRNKLLYRKLESKKFQLTRLSIKKIKNEKKIEKKRKTEVFNKSPMKTKFIDDNFINKNIKSVQISDSKKIKNKIEKKKIKEKEKSSILNININKIINQKEINVVRGNDKPASSIIDSIKTNKSNSNNNYITNKKSINLFSEKEPFKNIKNKRFVSDIEKKINNQYFKINNSNTTTKNSNNQNKFEILSLKEIKSIKTNNKDNNFNNKDIKKNNQNNIKIKIQNNNNNTNNNIIKEKNYNKFNNLNVKNMLKSKIQINTNKNNREEICKNNNNLNDINKNENKLIKNQYLNPVKKSLFSEHMNFLNNFSEEISNQVQNKNDQFLNYNYLNIPLNSILQSTENKEFESKFINYDLGILSGSSQIKDSLIAFGNEETCNNIKKNNLLENNNYFNGEKERTKEELEKLSIQYLNISKNLDNKNRLYKTDESQTNTITTIIDNNINDDIF